MPVPKIPVTSMRSLYGMFDLFCSLDCHLAMAEEARRDHNPATLAELFQRSVERFSDYSNVEEPFYPDHPPRKDIPDPQTIDRIAGTTSLTSFLKYSGTAQVVDNHDLDFVFVDRELVPARTTGNVLFENGDPSIRVRRLDWLLANAHDQRPVIAEVKVGDDKNPFYALIQLLMYAAELVTPAQLTRLRRHYPDRFKLPASADGVTVAQGPVMDLYIIISNFNPRSELRQEILETTSELAQLLVVEEGVSRYIRKIACLDVTLEKDKQLRFTKVFSYSDR